VKARVPAVALLALGACTSHTAQLDTPVDVQSWIPSPATQVPQGEPTAPGGQPAVPLPVPEDVEDLALLIDLATTLRLAGAASIEIELARSRAREAAFNADAEEASMWPYLVTGGSFNSTDGRDQITPGQFITVDKQSTYLGVGAELVFDPDTIYTSLAARQRGKAASHALTATTNTTLLRAAEAYFALVASHSRIQIAAEALQVAQEVLGVATSRLEAGAGLPASVARARALVAQTEGDLEAARGEAEIDSALLVEVLQLEARLSLTPRLEDASAPIEFIPASEPVQTTLDRALANRPELSAAAFELEATQAESDLTGTGWLIPELRAGASFGGFGPDLGDLGDQENYYVAALWTLDFGMGSRHAASLQRQDQATLTLARLRNAVERSVITAHRRILAGRARIAAARREVEAATENLSLVVSREGAGAEILLTVLDAQSTLTRAQTALVSAVAEHNAAQYALLRAVGGL
jgi:outer membrane protein TolC